MLEFTFSYFEQLWYGIQISKEFIYTVLVFGLFVLPRVLVRVGLPIALSAFFFGIGSTFLETGLDKDPTIHFLSTLGIISLFLFAGMEVEMAELKNSKNILFQHILIRLVLLGIVSFGFVISLGIDIRPSALLALAILTPSTGFILDSLDNLPVPNTSKYWIKIKAVATEIVALIAMFILGKSMSIWELTFSSLALLGLVLLLPVAFRFFSKSIAPFAPKSEFGFLLMTALTAGLITKNLGAYYLIGAFIVGLVAHRFEEDLPKLTSKAMLKSMKFFSGFFTPFYFFYAGMHIQLQDLSISAILLGLAFLFIFIPIRLFTVVVHRKLFLKEGGSESFSVATGLLPNLVFGLVLAQMLRDNYNIDPVIFGGLIIYTIGTTVLPPLLLRFFWKSPEYSYIVELENNFGLPNPDEPNEIVIKR